MALKAQSHYTDKITVCLHLKKQQQNTIVIHKATRKKNNLSKWLVGVNPNKILKQQKLAFLQYPKFFCSFGLYELFG